MKKMLLDEVHPSRGNVTIHGHPYDPELDSRITDFWNKFDSGKIEQKITCLGCNNVSITTNSFMTLPLQFPGEHFHEDPLDMRRAISLMDMIRHFQYNEDDELTDYDCDHCSSRQRATKTYRICRYPEVLCIRIGRKRNDNSVIQNPVQYPFTGLQLTNIEDFSRADEPCYFKLIAAVNHQPSTNDRGHYTAVTKHNATNTWCEYNDDNVRKIKFQGRSKNFSSISYQRMASILFYEIDRNYSSINEQSTGRIYRTFHQDNENHVSISEKINYKNNRNNEKINHDNKNEKVESYDEFDIHDGIDNNLAKNETHQKTEQNCKNLKSPNKKPPSNNISPELYENNNLSSDSSDTSSESSDNGSLFSCPNMENDNSRNKGKRELAIETTKAIARPRRLTQTQRPIDKSSFMPRTEYESLKRKRIGNLYQREFYCIIKIIKEHEILVQQYFVVQRTKYQAANTTNRLISLS